MRFLITRPQDQADKLIELITRAGHKAVRLPAIEIRNISLSAATISMLGKLDEFAFAIFISANAVHKAADFIKKYTTSPRLNDYFKIAVIGPSTAKALEVYGWQVDIISDGKYDSEGLLQALKPFVAKNDKIIIFRGLGGRRVLAEGLQKMGVRVAEAPVYERTLPKVNNSELAKIFTNNSLDAILTMSNESLRNLYTLAGTKYKRSLLASKLVVLNQRCANLAKSLGFKNPAIIARAPDESSIFEALMQAG